MREGAGMRGNLHVWIMVPVFACVRPHTCLDANGHLHADDIARRQLALKHGGGAEGEGFD